MVEMILWDLSEGVFFFFLKKKTIRHLKARNDDNNKNIKNGEK